MPFTVDWDENSPSGSQDISLGDDRIREFKKQVRERLAVDHKMAAADDAQTGYHQKVTMWESASDPAQVANALILYSKNSGGARELYTRHESATLQQITKNGKIWLPSLVMDLQARGDLAYFDGTIWNRLTIGLELQQLRVNASRTDLEYFTASSFVANGSSVSSSADFSTTASSYEDITSLSITFVSTGRPLILSFKAGLMDYTGWSSGEFGIQTGFNVNGVMYGEMQNQVIPSGGSTINRRGFGYTVMIPALAAASYTIKMQAYRIGSNGTAIIKGSTLATEMSVVEV